MEFRLYVIPTRISSQKLLPEDQTDLMRMLSQNTHVLIRAPFYFIWLVNAYFNWQVVTGQFFPLRADFILKGFI